MVISETYGAQSGQALKENAPHEAGHYLNLGGPGRNRTGPRMPDSTCHLRLDNSQQQS